MPTYTDQKVELSSVDLGSVTDAGIRFVMEAASWDNREARVTIYQSSDNSRWRPVCTTTYKPTDKLLEEEGIKEIVFAHNRKQASRTRTYYKAEVEVKGELEVTKLSLA